MLQFVAVQFRSLISLSLWLILIGCAIGGAVIGSYIFDTEAAVGIVIGLIFGGLVGVVATVLYGGMIANFLNLVDDTKTIKEKLDDLENIYAILGKIVKKVNSLENQVCGGGDSVSTSSDAPTVVTQEPSAVASGAGTTSWWCKECGKKNTGASTKCAYCNG